MSQNDQNPEFMPWVGCAIQEGCPYLFDIDDPEYPDRNGIWFSIYDFHKDTKTWSHDESFPIRLERAMEHTRFMIGSVIHLWANEAARPYKPGLITQSKDIEKFKRLLDVYTEAYKFATGESHGPY